MLPGAVRRCGCATLSHSYTLALGPVDPVRYYRMAITGMPKWSLVSPVRCHGVLFMGFTSAAIKFGSVSADPVYYARIATGAGGGYWGLPG